jgi:dethiobiotin synthetase
MSPIKQVAIIGIHTGIGKTISSAIICEALQADYWKPVQAGNIEDSDSIVVASLLSNSKTTIHKEAHILSQPLSPHIAARLDSTEIIIEQISIPATDNLLVIETAGGLMSPLNDTQTNLDLILHFRLPVILVSQNYLGSINHTLLTCEVLKQHNIDVKGILFTGEETPATQDYILNHTGYKCLGVIPYIALHKGSVIQEAGRVYSSLQNALK